MAGAEATGSSGLSLAERRNRPQLQVQKKTEEEGPKRRIRKLVPPEKIEDYYEYTDDSYSGSNQSKVRGAKIKATGKDVIVKIRARKFAVGGEGVWVQLLTRMLNLEEHSHVLGLHDVLEDEGFYYMVMEKCAGGELFDFLQTETDVPERECKRIMREILQAVDHVHTQGLIHRDIKPENILFHDTRDGDPASPVPGNQKAIKLIDFDTCQDYTPQSPKSKHIVGTMGYIAPEALRGEYSPASDLWSVGVILYILMTGDMPFSSDLFADDPGDTRCGSLSMESLYAKLKGAKLDFECDPWPAFPQAKDLCQQLLAFEPGDRSPSALACLSHPWLKA